MNWRPTSVWVVCLTATFALLTVSTCPTARAATLGFGQVDWGDGSGGYDVQNSDWGQVTVSLSLSDLGSLAPDGFGGYYGYVNIVTDVLGGSLNNWAVQNMLMYYNDVSELGAGQLPTTAYFSLGQPIGSDVTSLDYSFTLSPTPLTLQPSGPTTLTSVANVTRVDGVSTDEFSPGALAWVIARNYQGSQAGTTVAPGGSIVGSTTNVPAINESVNGCAPGSVARSLVYLSRAFPSVVLTQTPQQVYAGLTNAMGQVPGSAANVLNGNQTTNSQFALGKSAFVASNGLQLANLAFTNTALYGGFFGNSGSNAFSGAISSLNATGDVEVWISWGTITNHNNSGTNFVLGAHQAFVTAIRPHITSSGIVGYTIWYIDDPVQGDTNAENSLKQMTVDFNGNELNPGANVAFSGVVGFFIEQVPEPSVFGLTVLGAFALALLRRRRRR